MLGFIEVGKKDGKLEMGGNRVGDKGYLWVDPVFRFITALI